MLLPIQSTDADEALVNGEGTPACIAFLIFDFETLILRTFDLEAAKLTTPIYRPAKIDNSAYSGQTFLS